MVKHVSAPLLSALLYQEAANRYATGLLLERLEDDEGAFDAFHDAADAGFAPAQRKLGDIFAKGNGAIDRDYYLSLHWYRKARDAGEQIPSPDFASSA